MTEAVPRVQGADLTTLDKQLEQLRKRVIYRAFHRLAPKGDPLKLPVLFRVVDTLESTLWAGNTVDKTKAINKAVKAGIALLPGRENIPGTNVSLRQAALILYNFETLTASIKRQIEDKKAETGSRWDKEFEQLVAWLKIVAEAKPGDSYIDEFIIPEVRKQLALRLWEMEEIHLISEAAEFEHGYVPRPELQKQIRDTFKNGQRVVLLHGDAGTGKSCLARAIITLVLDSHAHINDLVIDAKTETSLDTSIDSFMERYEPEVDASNMMRLRRKFQRFLASDSAPPIVVLDNVQDSDVLNLLVPSEPRYLVVVTSRSAIENDHLDQLIPVNNMEEEEAYRLVAQEAPGIADEDIATLARALDYRPLAIAHGCACLQKNPFNGNVREFCNALPAVLKSYRKGKDQTLWTIYQITINQLASDPDAVDVLKVLDLVLVFGPIIVDFDHFLSLVYSSSKVSKPLTIPLEEKAQFNKAVEILQERNLVRPHEVSVIHDLTAEILFELRIKGLAGVMLSAMLQLVRHFRIEDWPGGYPLPRLWPSMAAQLVRYRYNFILIFNATWTDHIVIDYLTAIALRELREKRQLAIWLRYDVVYQVLSRLEASSNESFPLYREVLELGYVDGMRDDTGVLITDKIRATSAELFMFSAMPSSFLDPIGRLLDDPRNMVKAEYGRDILEGEDRISEVLNSEQLSLSDWRDFFNSMFFAGVANLHECQWSRARGWLVRCLEFCEEAKSANFLEAYIFQLAVIQKMIEVGLYGRDLELCDEYSKMGRALIVEIAERCIEASESPTKYIDFVVGSRFLLSARVAAIEILFTTYANLTKMGPDNRGPAEACIDGIRGHLADLLTQREELAVWGLALPEIESEFHFNRWSHLFWDSDKVASWLMSTSNRCRNDGYGVAEVVCFFSVVKIRIAEANREDVLLFVDEFPKTLDWLYGMKNPYWHADALNTAYAAELFLNRSKGKIAAARASALTALAPIGREDKLLIADQISNENSAAILLLMI